MAFKRWTKALGDLAMVLIVVTEAQPKVALRRLLARVGFVLVPVSILFIKYYPDLGRSYNRWSWLPSWTGVTTNKNELGMVCLVLGLGCLWRLVERFKTEKRGRNTGPLVAQGALMAMIVWLLFTANSIISLSCFLMASVIIVVGSFPSLARRRWVMHCLVAGILCVTVSTLFLGLDSGALETMGRDPTLTGRTEIWNALLKTVVNPLAGCGYGSFWLGDRLSSVRNMFRNNPLMEAHNGYLEVYLNLGWVGMLLLAFVLATGYRRIVALIRQDPGTGSLRLAYLVVALVYNFTEAAFKELNPIWIFLLFAVVGMPKVVAPEVLPAFQAECSDCPKLEPQAGHLFGPEPSESL